MPRAFLLDGRVGQEWTRLAHMSDNLRRLVRIRVERTLDGLRFVLDHTWGNSETRVVFFYMDP